MKKLDHTMTLALAFSLCMFCSVSWASCTWTGGANTGNWTDARNWQGGAKPQSGDVVDLAGGVALVDSADFNCSSVSLSGGELILSVVQGSTANLTVPVTGSGTFCKAGKGVLCLQSGKLASGLSLCVDDGLLDLNGLAQTFATVFGGGTITNSMSTEAVLTVSNSQSASLTAKVSGLVKIVKDGDGELSVGGGQTYSGDTLVNGGVVCAITNVAVESVDGCVVHLDASRPDTMVLDSANHVVAWRSTVGDGLVFRQPAASSYYPTDLPFYQAKGINNKLPCVRFGFTDLSNESTSHTLTFLSADRTVNHRTLIFVTMPKSRQSEGAQYNIFTPYGYPFIDSTMNGEQARLCYKVGSVSVSSPFYGKTGTKWNDGNPYQYLNGKCEWTPSGSVSGNAWFNWEVDGGSRPHVITTVLPSEADTVSFPPSVGCGRIYWNGMSAGTVTDWFAGSLCEVLVFDRTLSDVERSRIETALIRKWQLTHKGDTTFENPLSPNSTVVLSGDDAIDFGGMDIKVGGLSVKDGGSYVFDVPDGQVQLADLGVVSGPGTLEKRGSGVLKLKTSGADSSTPVELHVDDGVLDLDGGFLAASKVLGGGVVTNSAATVATFNVDSAEDGVLTASVRGFVNFIKAGTGRLAVGGGQTYAGNTGLAGGTLSTTTNVAVESVDGCVVHLDASRPDTMVLDSANHVIAWRSTAGDGLVFRQPAASSYYPTDLPFYQAKGINNKLPCVRFGFTDLSNESTSHTLTFLSADKTVNHRTLIFVTMPKSRQSEGNQYNIFTPYGYPFIDSTMNGEQARLCYKVGSVSGNAPFYGKTGTKWNDGNPYQYLNGKCEWTPSGSVSGNTWFNWEVDGGSRPHVITTVLPDDAATVSFPPSVGCGRIYWNGMSAGTVTDWFAGSLCEVLVFDRTLSDVERSRIETALIRKWQLTHKGDATFENPISPNSTVLKISGDARLEPGDAPRDVVSSLVVDAGNSLVLPKLTYAGTFAATSVSLVFENLNDHSFGPFFEATVLTGQFGSASGLGEGQRVSYRANQARVAKGGFCVLLK